MAAADNRRMFSNVERTTTLAIILLSNVVRTPSEVVVERVEAAAVELPVDPVVIAALVVAAVAELPAVDPVVVVDRVEAADVVAPSESPKHISVTTISFAKLLDFMVALLLAAASA